jgi:hypothetical protein
MAVTQTTLASVGPNGAQGDDASSSAVLSRDGGSVLFSSSASNLVAGDANGEQDVFVKDLEAGTTKLVPATAEGAQSNGYSTGRHFGRRPLRRVRERRRHLAPHTNSRSDIFLKNVTEILKCR